MSVFEPRSSSGPSASTVCDRDRRAAEECLAVASVYDAPMLFEVAGEDGTVYVVSLDLGACECRDWQYRKPTGGCKHLRRVEMALGERPVPASVEVDRLLAQRPAVDCCQAETGKTVGGEHS